MYDDVLYAELAALPTVHQGQADDCKIDTGTVRVWLSRLTPADGVPRARAITAERRNDHGDWRPGTRHDIGEAVAAWRAQSRRDG